MKKKFALIIVFLVSLCFLTSCTPSHNSMSRLNSSWECEYLKLKTSKRWAQSDGSVNSTAYASWWWDDKDGKNQIKLTVRNFSFCEKLDRDEAEAEYNRSKKADDMHVEKKFVSNGQAYLIIAKPLNGNTKKIIFYADKLEGEFEFTYYDESIVKKMIDSITFYDIK